MNIIRPLKFWTRNFYYYIVTIFKPVNKIKATKTGETYFKIMKMILVREVLAIVPPLDNASLKFGQPHTQVVKIAKSKPPNGSRIFDDT